MTTFDAVYQDGVFRPATPPDLPEGTAVKVSVVPEPAPQRQHDPAAIYAMLKEIADMPAEGGDNKAFSGRDHDKILYGGPNGAR